MKIYKENIKRIIQILQEKDLELKEDEYFEFEDNQMIKSSFKLPEFFAVRAITKENGKILYKYFNDTYNHAWNAEIKIHLELYLNFKIIDNTLQVGASGEILDDYIEITAVEFIEHVILKNK